MTARGPFAFLYADRGGQVFLGILLALAILVPVLNQFAPPNSFWHVPTWVVSLLGKYVCFALLALSVDLIWGFCGILSLGHGAFFALGGYAMGMYLMRQIGDRGVYGNPDLPDFMVFLNWKELPWYWHGFDNFGFAMLMVLLVPGLLGFVFGWLTFRSRVTGVYLSIISQAMTYALLLAFFRNDMGFGGNNGLTDFKDIVGYNLQEDDTHWVVCRFGNRVGTRIRIMSLHRDVEIRTGSDRDPRCRRSRPISRLPGRILQAVRLHPVVGTGRRCGCPVRATGRYHQSR